MPKPLTRREFAGSAIFGGAAMIATSGLRAAWGEYPFTLGVASGDPRPDGVVLWTRLAPAALEPDGGMPAEPVPVRWEVSRDEHFGSVRSGTAIADPDWAHSVHIEVDGLEPGRPYFYRFIAGGVASPVGRTRTAPAPGTAVDRLRFAFASCQHYEAGFYAAYRHMVADDPDLVIFLGDYIYEGNPGHQGVRTHLNPEPVDLDGYRVRYATYKRDPWLQAAHQTAPWLTTWDDHEVQDNYAGDRDKYNHDPAVFLRRRAAAYKAYYEHMPLRAMSRPDGPSMRLYRSLDWGRLAQFQIIDDRQYRDPPACQLADAIAKNLSTAVFRPDCAERHDPRRSILGETQHAWLDEQLKTTRARWNFLSQQTLMMPFRRVPRSMPDAPPSMYNTDNWDGFPATRNHIVRQWRDAHTPNPISIGGDIHAFAAGDLVAPENPRQIIATEFVGSSISSIGRDPTFNPGAAREPGFHFGDNSVRGYGLGEVTSDRCAITFRGVLDSRAPDSAIRNLARFVVEDGKPGVQSI